MLVQLRCVLCRHSLVHMHPGLAGGRGGGGGSGGGSGDWMTPGGESGGDGSSQSLTAVPAGKSSNVRLALHAVPPTTKQKVGASGMWTPHPHMPSTVALPDVHEAVGAVQAQFAAMLAAMTVQKALPPPCPRLVVLQFSLGQSIWRDR